MSISPTICEQLHWLHMEMLHLCGLIWCVHLTPNSVLTILTSKCCTFVNWFDVCLKVIFPRSFILTIRALKCYTFGVNVFLKIVWRAGRLCLICSLTAWGCQSGHNGPFESLGWQGGDFAFSASFWILNEIMPPGHKDSGRGESGPWLVERSHVTGRWWPDHCGGPHLAA